MRPNYTLWLAIWLLVPGGQRSLAETMTETIAIQSGDSLEITADLNLIHEKSAPFVVLFHQTGWSRGEYREIAPKLNELGFNTLAVDQRSGGKVNDVRNETHARP